MHALDVRALRCPHCGAKASPQEWSHRYVGRFYLDHARRNVLSCRKCESLVREDALLPVSVEEEGESSK